MKTKTKIQTKKSTAVSVVSIEGHPVPASSPSKVLGGLLSFKGEIMKTKKQIENELEHQKLLYSAIRLIEHYEGSDDPLNLDRVERFVSKHSDGDAFAHLEQIFAFQWVLDKKREVPRNNYDDIVCRNRLIVRASI